MKLLKENKFLILVLICTIFVIMIPNLDKGLLIGDDYIYHLARIQSMVDTIKGGIFPVKVNSTLANNFGYASSTFYPDLFLYIPCFLMIIFKINLVAAYKIFILLVLCFMFFIFYKSFYYLTNNKISAIFGTIFLMLSKVLFLSLYDRFALGEFLGFCFILPALVRNV